MKLLTKDSDTLILTIDKSINSTLYSYEYLSEMFNVLLETTATTIIFNISDIFIAANQFAVLGCIIEFCQETNKKFQLDDKIPYALKILMRRNNFGIFFNLSHISDINNTVVPYKRFYVDEILEYERYLTIELFNRNDMKDISDILKDNIRDYLLEIFKNVKDHTSSKKIYTCGQFFPKKSLLYFTIVDKGETIYYNVSEYHKRSNLSIPNSPLKWALEKGNTTLNNNGPRGIGLFLIKNFITSTNGYFCIVSDNEMYEIRSNNDGKFFKLKYTFPGTIVTIAFNIQDNVTYNNIKDDVIPIKF